MKCLKDMDVTKRLHDNLKVLDYLRNFLINNPDLRFNQSIEILNGGKKNYFNEEPSETLKRWLRKDF